MRIVAYIIGTALLIGGLAILLGVGGLYAMGEIERLRFEQELAATPLVTATPEPTPSPTPTVQPSPTRSSRSTAVASATPAPTATTPPTATPAPRPAQRIVAPKIKLDSRVVESPIKNGLWEVPKFVAGHLELTANPGEAGNIALAGHVESISSGNVFANIDGLEVGDEISVFTDREEFRYRVAEKRIVKNNDISVVQPTQVETLTLITCYGTWLPATRDYDRRLVVIAHREPAPPPRVREARSE